MLCHTIAMNLAGENNGIKTQVRDYLEVYVDEEKSNCVNLKTEKQREQSATKGYRSSFQSAGSEERENVWTECLRLPSLQSPVLVKEFSLENLIEEWLKMFVKFIALCCIRTSCYWIHCPGHIKAHITYEDCKGETKYDGSFKEVAKFRSNRNTRDQRILTGKKMVMIISHPHGSLKRVTIGNNSCKEKDRSVYRNPSDIAAVSIDTKLAGVRRGKGKGLGRRIGKNKGRGKLKVGKRIKIKGKKKRKMRGIKGGKRVDRKRTENSKDLKKSSLHSTSESRDVRSFINKVQTLDNNGKNCLSGDGIEREICQLGDRHFGIESFKDVELAVANTNKEMSESIRYELSKINASPLCFKISCATFRQVGKGKEDEITLSEQNRSLSAFEDILVDPGFKLRPQTWIVGIVDGPTTMISGIPWSWLNQEKWRLHTFASYPHNAAKSAILLAEDGFAYNGSGADSDDSVICYFCTGSKRGWREDESIRETHRDLNPSCPIVSGARCNNVPMAASRNVSFASMTNSLSSFGALHQTGNEHIDVDVDDISGQATRSTALGAQALPTKEIPRPAQQRSRVQMASKTVMSTTASRQSTNSSTNFQATANTFNPIQPTDDGPSRTVTSNNFSSDNSATTGASQPTQANPRPGNNNIPQHGPQNNPNTSSVSQPANQLSVPRPVNQSAPVAQTTQSTPSAPVHQSNNQSNNPQTAPVNQPNNPQTAPVNQSNNPQTGPVNQTNTQETTPGNQTNSQNPTYYQLGIITERPKRHEYAVRQKRLDTFGDWPAGHHLKKEDLADAGFYYAGYGDCARCFYCGGGLRNWEEGDDVWVEHARWFPKCAFIRQRVGQVFIDTVAFFAEDHEKITFKMIVEKMDVDPGTLQIDSKETTLKSDPAVVTVKEMGYNEVEILRAATLHKENSQMLAADELFETLETTGAVRHSVGNRVYSTIEPSSDMPRDQEKLDRIKRNNNDLRLQYLCKVCMDKEVAIVFLPCGHLVCCTECSSAMRDCPVCRKSVKGVVRGFMA